MIDLDIIKAENTQRRKNRRQVVYMLDVVEPGARYAAMSFLTEDKADDVIDALVAEVERLRAALKLPWFPGYDAPLEIGQEYLMKVTYRGGLPPRLVLDLEGNE